MKGQQLDSDEKTTKKDFSKKRNKNTSLFRRRKTQTDWTSVFRKENPPQEEEKTYDYTIYTDGSCANGIGGYGIVVVRKDVIREEKGRVQITPCTNQKAELYAIRKGLELRHQLPTLTGTIRIRTDSRYAIGCLTTWIDRWIKNGWKTSRGEPVLNREEIEIIHQHLTEASSNWKIDFEYVPGHAGDSYNERADQLANQGRLQE